MVLFIQDPDTGKRRPQIIHHRLRAAPQHIGQVAALDKVLADPCAERVQVSLFPEAFHQRAPPSVTFSQGIVPLVLFLWTLQFHGQTFSRVVLNDSLEDLSL